MAENEPRQRLRTNGSASSSLDSTPPALKATNPRARPLQDDLSAVFAGMSIGNGGAAGFVIRPDEEADTVPATAKAAEGPVGDARASQDKDVVKSYGEELDLAASVNEKTVNTATNSEQVVLAVSSRVTDLLMAIQEISTIIFEIQEMRHATASNDGGDSAAPHTNGTESGKTVDDTLALLEAKLEDVNADFSVVGTQVRSVIDTLVDDPRGEMDFLQQKWADAASDWEGVQADAEQLAEELKEDKWLVVFRTVSQQAEEMQHSLEKALTHCDLFVGDAKVQLDSRQTDGTLSDAKRQHLLATCRALAKSLEAKVKYYSPACVRVLNILGKGIADRSTKNGEVMRRYGEMKTRWKTIQGRIDMVTQELEGVEGTLSAQGQSPQRARRAATFGSTLTPPRHATSPGARSPLRRYAADRTSPGPTSPSSRGLHPETPSRGGPLQQSTSSPTLATLGTVSSPEQGGRSSSKPTPPRPPKSLKRLVSDSYTPPSHDSHTPLLAVTPRPLAHRRSLSALSASVGPTPRATSQTREARRQSLRPISPMPPAPALADRPRWNASLKPAAAVDTTASATPARIRSGRSSAIGTSRPSSRMSLGSSMSRSIGPSSARPASPAFSDASSVLGRERPGTPSRIPRPSSGGRRRSSVFGAEQMPAFEGAASPPRTATRPSSRYSLSQSVGPGSVASPSKARVVSVGTRMPSRPTSPALSAASSGYRRGTTPEPSLMAQAHRIAGPRSSSVASRPPPVPRMPSSYRQGAPESGLMSPPRLRTPRPPSAAGSYGLDRSMTPLPGRPAPQEYVPNPHDPLDCAVADIANSMPVLLDVVRVEAPLSRAQAAQLELFQARYSFGHPNRHLIDSRKAVMCKLVDRVGARAKKGEKKVLARIGGGWQELEVYMLSLIANNC
ncbi:hypothetical protein JCM10908_006530 [Rhodotorula pacifica]|uniref:uncharacterized protein n=1 Tax=Rhodotorula pacifica TaxID=1495444 RepID=UPI0031745A12